MSERNIEKLKTVSEIEREAFAALPQVARDVLFRGASREQTLEDNEKAYERIRFCPSVLRDVGMVSVSTELLGIKLSSPILLAPTAYHGLYHPNKEVETVSGANLSKTPYVVSEYSSTALAELAHISKVPLLLNLIVHEDRSFTKGVIESAISSGVKALVVTVDQPVRSLHSRKVEVGVTLPPGIERVNFQAFVPTAAQQNRIQRRSYHYQWIALGLALTFGLYGLIRKVTPVVPLVGLAVETVLVTPIALILVGYWARQGQSNFGASVPLTLLFISCGLITSLPMLWFNNAAKGLPLSTLGFLQYLLPTLQLLLGVFLYREPFSKTHIIAFGCIWSGLAIYSTNLLWLRRSKQST